MDRRCKLVLQISPFVHPSIHSPIHAPTLPPSHFHFLPNPLPFLPSLLPSLLSPFPPFSLPSFLPSLLPPSFLILFAFLFSFQSLRDPTVADLGVSPPLSASLLNAWLPENVIDPVDVTEIQNELESASLLALFEGISP